jgi:very-short-patch-repair endonuclease
MADKFSVSKRDQTGRFLKGCSIQRTEIHNKKFGSKLKGRPKTLEHRRKLSSAKIGKAPWNKGIKLPLELRQKLSDVHKLPFSRINYCKVCGHVFCIRVTNRKSQVYCSNKCKIYAKPWRRNLVFISKFQHSIYDAVKRLYPESKLEYEINTTPTHRRADIYIPEKNLIIECDGRYWHRLEVQLAKDRIRQNELEEVGYRVIRVKEEEWRRNRIHTLSLLFKQIDQPLTDSSFK